MARIIPPTDAEGLRPAGPERQQTIAQHAHVTLHHRMLQLQNGGRIFWHYFSEFHPTVI